MSATTAPVPMDVAGTERVPFSRLAKVDALAGLLGQLEPDEILPAVGFLTAKPGWVLPSTSIQRQCWRFARKCAVVWEQCQRFRTKSSPTAT